MNSTVNSSLFGKDEISNNPDCQFAVYNIGELESGITVKIQSVSYTHLDVYKRQFVTQVTPLSKLYSAAVEVI